MPSAKSVLNLLHLPLPGTSRTGFSHPAADEITVEFLTPLLLLGIGSLESPNSPEKRGGLRKMYISPRKCHRQVSDLMARYLVIGLPPRLHTSTSEYDSDERVISRLDPDDPAHISA